MTFVNNTLESVAIPPHVEITMVHRAGSVAIREAAGERNVRNFWVKQERHDAHEWLVRVLGLTELIIETGSVIVHLVEDTGKAEGEVGRAVTTVWPSAAIRDVGLMVRRVGIFPVPAALEILGGER